MGWNIFELTAFFVLSLAPIVVLAVAGRFVRLKQSRVWLNWYLSLGLLSSAALMFFGGPVMMKVFPPPYVPGLSEGRGIGSSRVARDFWFLGWWGGRPCHDGNLFCSRGESFDENRRGGAERALIGCEPQSKVSEEHPLLNVLAPCCVYEPPLFPLPAA